jgi:D-sedoheptulose 7-phosphate isomerase
MNEYVGSAQRYLDKLVDLLSTQSRSEIDTAIGAIAAAWHRGNQIIVFGNGGSAMTALHFVTDWSKMISIHGKKPFLARTLLDNIGLITAYANDISYSEIFREQLKVILGPGDIALAISGSGNSENVIRAIDYANQNGAITLGLCAYRGGKLKDVCQLTVWADVDDMQLGEDLHAIFGHIVMQSLCGIG